MTIARYKEILFISNDSQEELILSDSVMMSVEIDGSVLSDELILNNEFEEHQTEIIYLISREDEKSLISRATNEELISRVVA